MSTLQTVAKEIATMEANLEDARSKYAALTRTKRRGLEPKTKIITIEQARKKMAQAFIADPDFRDVYVANVACILMDRIPGFQRNKNKRNKIADEIIRRIFE